MYKIGVMGDRSSVFSFAAVGFTVFPVEDEQEAVKTLRTMINNGYAVIYITEKLAQAISAEIDRYAEEPIPAIIPIPGVSGNTGIGMKSVSKSVEKAVGSDILGN